MTPAEAREPAAFLLGRDGERDVRGHDLVHPLRLLRREDVDEGSAVGVLVLDRFALALPMLPPLRVRCRATSTRLAGARLNPIRGTSRLQQEPQQT